MQIPSRKFHLGLVGITAVNTIVHWEEHAVILVLVCSIAWAWRILFEYQKVPLPKAWFKPFLVIYSFAIVFMVFGTLIGMDAAIGLIISMVSMKLVDNVRYRDAQVMIFSNYLILATGFLVSQSLGMTLLAFISISYLASLLFQLNNVGNIDLDLKRLIKMGLKLSLHVLPLLTLLFFVFPRFGVGFIRLQDQSVSSSGFSDDLEPGSIDRLILDDSLAFRVNFFGDRPRSQEMYWKGAALIRNRGMKWDLRDRSSRYRPKDNIYSKPTGKVFEYEIIQEDSYGKWLFSLDKPVSVFFSEPRKMRQVYISEAGNFHIKNKTNSKLLYRLKSSFQIEDMQDVERRKYLQAPVEEDPRLIEMVQRIKNNSNTIQEKVDAVLSYFENNLKYSLRPGKLESDSVGAFLFDRKIGFCEHFSASFAHVMRLLKIPARVAIGFQGARPNPFSEHLTVTNRDAHAWVEIYNNDRSRWERVDPTEVVAPQRILLGGQIYFDLNDSERGEISSQEKYWDKVNQAWVNRTWTQIQFYWDYASREWNYFLLNYDFNAQLKLLEKLGLKNISKPVLFLISLFIVFLFGLFYKWRMFKKPEGEPADLEFYKIAKVAKEKNLFKVANETPLSFLERLKSISPSNLEKDIDAFKEPYTALKYTRITSANARDRLQKDLVVSQRKVAKTIKTLKKDL
ncbi:MAG: transglutaminaseTgpA domain-containing protein [Bdellovibrionales bacterium]